jgi:uroporphyrinogen-III synthase
MDLLRLLLTRPQDQSETFAAALEAAFPGRFDVTIAPLLRIVPVAAELRLDGGQALLFTSANGVEMFAARTPDRGLPAFCVGDMTTRAARDAGFAARSADGDVEALAALARAELDPAGGALLHVRGVHAAGDLAGRLIAEGYDVRPLALYDQAPAELTDAARDLLGRGALDAVAVFSPRTARLLGAALGRTGHALGRAALVALSPAVVDAYDGPPAARIVTAETPTRAGMIAALASV